VRPLTDASGAQGSVGAPKGHNHCAGKAVLCYGPLGLGEAKWKSGLSTDAEPLQFIRRNYKQDTRLPAFFRRHMGRGAHANIRAKKRQKGDRRREEHADGYIIMHQIEGVATVQHTCCCGNKGCVTKTCPGWSATCDCTGSSPRITCN
jgi:hypothetical protein